ncbi:MAG: M18 family aminopeptidase [Oscillospiraceae bacterium]|nr:M18 family aminopeptidase [Oscillospiraceae bacterium]
MYQKLTEEMLAFIQKNPTAFHTAASITEALEAQGFTELPESAPWTLEPGRAYCVRRNSSSVIAFRLGTDLRDYSFQIAAAHTDSPLFRLKERAELETAEYTRLNTEGYGGMICSTWLDRPLSAAGRVLLSQEDGSIKTALVNLDRDLLLIPSVAIHMNRAVNDGFAFNKQVDLLPLFAGKAHGTLKKLIAEELGVSEERIMGSDLYLYNRDRPAVWGCNSEFVSSPRLDDQQCVFSLLKGFLAGGHPQTVSVLACFDNEEVGSGTKQGAASTFLEDVLRRINLALGRSGEDYLRALASSFMVSADNAHAVHPNHPEHTDPNNCTCMNEGVVVKSHAGQKYTSDGLSIAMLRTVAARAEVPLQYFSNRSDKRGGSTLGNIAMTHVSVKCVDVGLPQLAMHSCYETAGVRDTWYMVKLMEEFFRSKCTETSPGTVKIEK